MIKSDPSKFANSLARQSHTRLNGTLISQRQSASIFWYKSPFGRFIIRQKSQYTDFGGKGDEELETSSQTSWVFVPSFFSRCLIFRSVNKMGSIERSFRTWPVIPQDHPVWDICRNGNIIEFQTLLSSRAISPFSVDQFGWTLLHVRYLFLHRQWLFDDWIHSAEHVLSNSKSANCFLSWALLVKKRPTMASK